MASKIHKALPTQKTIAKAVGVSRETVAQILNGREAHRYNEETRAKVLQTAKELGYRPHRAAQIMRKGRSNLIAIMHFGTNYRAIKKAVHYVSQGVSANGYDIFTVELSWHGGSYRRVVEQLVDLRVEGVIILYPVLSFNAEEIGILERAGIPAVQLEGGKNLDIPWVYMNISAALTDMVRHLHGIGHRRLLLLANDYESRSTLGRIEGFQNGIRQFPDIQGEIKRLPADREINESESAYQYIRHLIASRALPDVILCTNDSWARTAFAALLEAGLRVPEDVAVTGVDNEPFGAQTPYHLTTASPDIARGSAKVVEMLMDLIAGRPLAQQVCFYPYELVIRRSCGASSLPSTCKQVP